MATTEQEMRTFIIDNKAELAGMRSVAQTSHRFIQKMKVAMQPINYNELAGIDNSHIGILLQFGIPPISKESDHFVSWMLNYVRQAKQMSVVVPEVNSTADAAMRNAM